MGVRFPAVSKLRKMLAGESMTHRKELHDLHELPGPTVHRRRALLPLAAAALCASVLVFVHVQQDQAAVLSTASFLVSSRAPATFATKNAATNTNTQREQRLNAAAARAALAQKRVAEKAVKAADAIAAEAGRVGKPQAGGKVPAHCLRFAIDSKRVVHAPTACLRWKEVREVTRQARREGVEFVWSK